jgi:uncharacterized protein
VNIRNGRSAEHNSIGQCTRRALFCCYYIVACVITPLVALWPQGDPHPQTTAMIWAAQRGDVPSMDEILRGGVNVDSRDDAGITPLMAAARGGQLDAVRKLLAAGATIDMCATVHGTALMLAVTCGHHEIMRELIARGADVNSVTPTGQTALWYARLSEDHEAVRILTAAGAVAEGRAAAPGICLW